mgnify:CR=1 FL=1
MNIKGSTAGIDCLDYDEDEEEFIIDFSDVDAVYEGYTRSPLVNTFIKYEILVRRALVHEQDYKNVSRYEVIGYAYDEQGESYSVTVEWIQEARDWIDNEF